MRKIIRFKSLYTCIGQQGTTLLDQATMTMMYKTYTWENVKYIGLYTYA